jgi:hypothetical protein
MVARPSIVVVLAGALASLGASYRTPNFVVDAPTPQIAQQVGQYAEHYRREKAIQWLGQEMPHWPQPCPLKVTLAQGSGGATSFAFDNGQILGMDMHIEGTLERLLSSVLPHEVTHTVFAHYFRTPVPRWADEGGSVLSEDDIERNRHDQLVRQILNSPGRAIPLRRLFQLTKYPPDVMVLYAEGYSVTEFLVSRSSRPLFLTFIAQGMRGDWDGAARTCYHFRNIEELEQAWMQHLREGHGSPSATLASRNPGAAEGLSTQRVVVRQTVPPAQPLADAGRPIVRGQSPEGDDPANLYPPGQPQPASQSWNSQPLAATPTAAPPASPFPPAPSDWQSEGHPVPIPPPPPVLLGSPQVVEQPPVQLQRPVGVGPAPR